MTRWSKSRPGRVETDRTDDQLDPRTRRLLHEIDELKRLERQKRDTPRGSASYESLAEVVETQARRVFEIAQDQRQAGEEEGVPIPAPDWLSKHRID